MWRRNNNTNNTNTSMEPVLGYHAYPEQTMDERYLETIPEVESLYSRRSSVATNLPELPLYVHLVLLSVLSGSPWDITLT